MQISYKDMIGIKLNMLKWNFYAIRHGLVEMVGIKWKWVMRYSRRSIGYCWSIIHNNRAAKSAVPVTNCRFNWKTGRDNPFVTFWTRLVLPKRRGLISIRWFSLASISLTLPYSATLSVKYSPSTMVLNLNGLFILRFFFNATFFANIRNIFEFILKDWLKWRNTL